MKLIFSDKEKRILNKVSKITGTDYVNDMSFDDLMTALYDMVVEYNKKEEELENLKNDVNENYEPKKIDWYDYYGISKNDFC